MGVFSSLFVVVHRFILILFEGGSGKHGGGEFSRYVAIHDGLELIWFLRLSHCPHEFGNYGLCGHIITKDKIGLMEVGCGVVGEGSGNPMGHLACEDNREVFF